MERRKSMFFYILVSVITLTFLTILVKEISSSNIVKINYDVSFRTDILKYKYELELNILKEKMSDKFVGVNKINETELSRIKLYIPSIKEKYKNVIEIKKGNIYYKGKNEKYRAIAKQAGAIISVPNYLGEGTRHKAEASYNKPYIPNGFSYLDGTVNTGFVIVDNILENEFVWIPVKNSGLKANKSEMGDYKKIDFKDTSKRVNLEDTEDLTTDDMKKSIKNYGGFYIARYESGKETTSDKQDIIVSKKNANVYTNVTGEEAEVLAANFYDNQNVSTMLMPGAAFDNVIKFIMDTNKCSLEEFKLKSIDAGNFESVVIKTGTREQYKINNIYDLGGNVFEYTAEKNKPTNQYVLRGGCVGYDPLKIDITRRNIAVQGYDKSEFLGFRTAMYIK